MATPLQILVTGATGKQGGTLARLLMSRGHGVRALTRNPHSAAAAELAGLGAEIVTGAMEDRASIAAAMRGMDATFLVTTAFETGAQSEIRQGVTVADAAAWVGLRHLVYSSVPQAQTRTGIPLFDSKVRIEEHIKSVGVPYTVIAPNFFMENLSGPYHLPALHEGRLAIPLSRTRKLQMISVQDVAAFATLVLEQSQRFLGKRIELASDELTPAEIAQVLSRVLGSSISHYRTPIQEVRVWNSDLAMVYDSLDRVGTNINIERLLSEYAALDWRHLESWAEAQSWGLLLRDHVEELA